MYEDGDIADAGAAVQLSFMSKPSHGARRYSAGAVCPSTGNAFLCNGRVGWRAGGSPTCPWSLPGERLQKLRHGFAAAWQDGWWRHTIRSLRYTEAYPGISRFSRGHRTLEKRRWDETIQNLVLTEVRREVPCAPGKPSFPKARRGLLPARGRQHILLHSCVGSSNILSTSRFDRPTEAIGGP